MDLLFNIRGFRQKSLQLIRKDGLSDIAGGLMLAFFAIFFYDFKYSIGLILGCAMQTIFLPLGRKYITYPRIGYAKFPDPAGQRKYLRLWYAILILITLGLITCIALWVSTLFPLFVFMTFAVLTFIGAYANGYLLDYIFVFIFVICGFAGLIISLEGVNPFFITAVLSWLLAAVLVPLGLIQLIFFLGKYSKSSEEVGNEIAG